MRRLGLIVVFMLMGTAAAMAQQAGTAAAPPAAGAPAAEIASCKQALPQLAPLLQATEDYTAKLGAMGPGNDTSIPAVLTGARRAALGDVYDSFGKLKPDLARLQGDLQVLVAVATACANGQTTP